MEFWDNVQSLHTISHCLMWASIILAIAAAAATGLRYYVDRRVGELSGEAQRLRDEDARKRQEAAEQELHSLRTRVAPRQLRDPEILLANLRGGPTGTITILASTLDAEAKAYAAELLGVLRQAGWQVDFPERRIPVNAPPGLTIVVSTIGEPPARAGHLQHALRHSGIEAQGIADTELPQDAVTLIVGQKPSE